MTSEYVQLIRGIKPKKSLGQSFLINSEIAKVEANYGAGKRVLELGPGFGILTGELCGVAKSVVAIEKDSTLFSILEARLKCGNAKLVNGDFFDIGNDYANDCDIMISNIPYNLSSRVISWLAEHRMPALLCMQKEFVEHMLARPDTRKYSKLSVMAGLSFDIYQIMGVKAGNFYPRPKVDSAIVFMKPKGAVIPGDVGMVIAALIMHKKKTVRNAILDSRHALGIADSVAREIAEALPEAGERVFKLSPEALEAVAAKISGMLKR
ncbi:MAG: rRNA adenine N-6-methyltransferase family protein [Candidatus Micrarchaeia archaeon]